MVRVKWKEAALQNPILPAAELYFMARPEKRVFWRKLWSLPPTTDGHLFSFSTSLGKFGRRKRRSVPEEWGRKKPRSTYTTVKLTTATAATATVVAEEKTSWKASPKSPLLWSACEIGATASDSLADKTPVAFGSAAKAAGSRCGGGGRLGGSIKMAADLKEAERILLEKNFLLRKEVNEQKLVHCALIEKNERLLKGLEDEMNMAEVRVEEIKKEEPHCLPFDLNLPASSTDLDFRADDGSGGSFS